MKAGSLIDDEWLKITDLENMFSVTEDAAGMYVYNMNETIYVNIDESQLLDFVCDQRMFWPLISYRIYGTTRLAWLLMKLNKVGAGDAFKPKQPSDVVKYVGNDYVQMIVKDINDYDEY